MWTCPKCGASVDSNYASCWSCHAQQPDPASAATAPVNAALIDAWTCPKCSASVDAGFDTCWSCGTSVDGVEDPTFTRADEEDIKDKDEPEPEPEPDPHALRCPRCHGVMEEGFLADYIHGGVRPSQWIAGAPQSSFWTGTWTGDVQYRVQTYRCRGCGYLESYAPHA